MEMLSSKIKEEACGSRGQYGDIDVIVCRDDFKEIDSTISVLSSEFLDYFLSKNKYRFAIVRFRLNTVDVDNILDWKSSKEECEISRDLRNSNIRVPCADKAWCSKHGDNLYKTALRAALGLIDITKDMPMARFDDAVLPTEHREITLTEFKTAIADEIFSNKSGRRSEKITPFKV